MEEKNIEEAIKKAKETTEKMNLEEPYKSLTYSKLLEKFLAEEETTQSIQHPLKEFVGSEIPQIQSRNNYRQAIIELLSTTWGNIPRTAGEIKEALEMNAIYVPTSSIASTLIQLVKSSKLRRLKKGELLAYVLSRRE